MSGVQPPRPPGDEELALQQTAISDQGLGAPGVDRPTLSVSPDEVGVLGPDLPRVDRTRYKVDGELARGGLGRILRARDVHLDRQVAIKEMLSVGGDAERRFVREALITARLEHPAIVPVHDAGRGADGAPFYAMKLVGGRPLAEVAAAARTIGQRLALVPTVLSVADALAYAHSQGVIHRDLKPHNVLVGEFGEVVVIDWGLAKDLRAPVDADLDAAPATPSLVGRADTLPPNVDDGAPPAAAGTGGRAGLHPRSQASLSATVGGAVLGTPAYMAPEQAAGDPVDERADVYALGAMLYEVLAGIGPHHGKTIDDVLRNVVSGRIKPLAERVPEVPRDLAAIVGQAMAREPAARYRSARELAEDLRRYVTGQLVAVYQYGWRERAWRWLRRNRAPVAVAAVAAAVLAVVATVAIQRVVAERDEARAARRIAEVRQGEARAAADRERARGHELLIAQAQGALATDPTRALALLAQLPEDAAAWSAARVVAAAAHAVGVGDVLVGHLHPTEAVAVSADGARVASVDRRELRVWDLPARTVRVIPLPPPCGDQGECQYSGWQLALSSDGRTLGAAAGQVYLWDVDEVAAPARTFAGDAVWLTDDGATWLRTPAGLARLAPGATAPEVVLAGAARAWQVASSGEAAVAIADDGLRVWRAGAVRARGGAARAEATALSASGRVLAWAEARVGDDGRVAPRERTTLWVWALDEAAPRGFPVSWPHHLVVSLDDTTVSWLEAGGRARWLRRAPVVDLGEGSGPSVDAVLDLVAGPTAGQVVAFGGGRVEVVDEVLGPRTLLADHVVRGVARSGEGRVIALAGGPAVRLWRLDHPPAFAATGPAPPRVPGAAAEPRVRVTPDVVASADGATLVIDWLTGPVELWRRDGQVLARVRELPIEPGSDLAVSPDGRHVLYVGDDGAAVLPLDGGAPVPLGGDAVLGWFARDGALYTASDDHRLQRWTLDGAGAAVCEASATWPDLAISGDGATVAAVVDGRLRRCRLATGAVDAIEGVGALTAWWLREDGGAVAGYDARAAAITIAGDDGRYALLSPSTPSEVRPSPDGRWLVALVGEGGFLIAGRDGEVRPVVIPGKSVREVVFLPGDRIAVGVDDAVVLADLPSAAWRAEDTGSTPGVLLAFPDGALIAALRDQVRVWLDTLPVEPVALRAAVLAATSARVGATGELVTAAAFTERR